MDSAFTLFTGQHTVNPLNPGKPFRGFEDLPMDEPLFADFRSKYLNLCDKMRSEEEKEKVSILDDIDFGEIFTGHGLIGPFPSLVIIPPELLSGGASPGGMKSIFMRFFRVSPIPLAVQYALGEPPMGKNTPHAIRGTQDMLGEQAGRFQHVVDIFERVRKLYGFGRIEVPVFEATAVFARSLGETTDVVSKEMYSFDDRGGDSLTLRPEFTVGIARAYLTNGWQQFVPLKVATHGPLFRYGRPQKGRFRQFHQLDAEIIGAAEPAADVELLVFADQLLKELGVADGVTLNLNTLGDAATRDAWRTALVSHFAAYKGDLSKDSQDRLSRNPLRILDSKDKRDRPIANAAPSVDDVMSDRTATFFEQVTTGLDAAGVAWERNPRLVRGLDYYRHTAFEFITDRLGAQGTVLGGGRYDGLIETLDGPETPAVGWAAGIERLAMLVDEPVSDPPFVALVPLGAEAEKAALRMIGEIRQEGVRAIMEFRGNMKRRMAKADSAGVRYAIILGSEELEQGFVKMKSMQSGAQRIVPMDHLGDRVEAQRATDLFNIRRPTRWDDSGNPIVAPFPE